MFLKVFSLFKFIIRDFNYFDKDTQSELVDVLTYYSDLLKVSKYEKR